MGKINSRAKGARGERLLAKNLREHGYECRRGQQFSGLQGDADVIGLPGIHIECKFVEKLNLLDAMEQSKRDARDGEMPVVMHKRNYTEWLCTLRLDDFMELYKAWQTDD